MSQQPPGRSALWAPWRMQYIETCMKPVEGCFLCHASAHPELDAQTLVVERREHALIILNRYPYTNGHLMVACHGHLANLSDLPDAAMLEMMQLTRDAQAMLSRVMKPDGFNIGINVGRVAGAGLPGHLHIHVVPRWNGDTNFMTAVGEVRVIPEALEATHAKLVAAAAELRGGLRD